ncbi:MAG: corrinoid protein [Actinomycetota bacterium]
MADIATLIAEIQEQEVLDAVREALEAGTEPSELLEQLRAGMGVVGERFEAKEYYLPDLIMTAEIFKEAVALIEPRLTADCTTSRGTVVIGTVKGDIHDIGKNIVVTMLRCNGFDVLDVGVDQPAGAFVDRARESGAKLVGLSGLLTVAFDAMKETVEAFEAAGLRDSVKIVIGGGPVNETVVNYTGADGWGRDPAEAVRLAEKYA